MSSGLDTKRAATIIGISSAVAVVSAAFTWYFRKRPSSEDKVIKKDPESIAPKSNEVGFCDIKENGVTTYPDTEEELEESGENQSTSELGSSNSEEEMASIVGSFVGSAAVRGGRRDYRQRRRPLDETAVQMNRSCSSDGEDTNPSAIPTLTKEADASASAAYAGDILNDPAIVEVSPASPASPISVLSSSHFALHSGEMGDVAVQLAAEFNGKCQLATGSTVLTAEETSHDTQFSNNSITDSNIFTRQSMFQNGIASDAPSPLSSIKCAESPPLSTDLQSEGSQDSGKGGSTVMLSSRSPVEEMIEIPAVYEFEVPRDIVGLLIGKQGTTIKWLTQQSQAHIVIREHFYSDRHKICTLEGTREQINMCLRYIRRKFPPSRFPDLKLTPLVVPPVTASHTPVWDNVVQLNLPEGVSCNVVVTSIVNGGHFFVQQSTHPTFPSLARLDQYMLAVYSQPMGVPALPRPVEAGIVCAAPVIGGWYRAQTMEVYNDTDEVLVKFVDYGGFSRVSAADLRQIRSDFMTLPFQATECYLAHVKPSNDKDGWSAEASAALEELTQGTVLEACVIGHASNSVPVVELYTPTPDSDAVSISRLLCAQGHAVWLD